MKKIHGERKFVFFFDSIFEILIFNPMIPKGPFFPMDRVGSEIGMENEKFFLPF